MIDAELTGYKISRLNMLNNLQDSGRLALKSSFDFEVTYDIEGETAVAVLTERLSTDGEPNEFYIDLTLEGIFHITGVKSEAAKKKVHVKCYDELFPYAAQLINQLAANSGMSNVFLKKRTIKLASVNLGEKPKSDKIIEFKLQK